MVIVRQSFGGYEDCQKSLYSKGLTQKIVFLIQVDSKNHSKKSIRGWTQTEPEEVVKALFYGKNRSVEKKFFCIICGRVGWL